MSSVAGRWALRVGWALGFESLGRCLLVFGLHELAIATAVVICGVVVAAAVVASKPKFQDASRRMWRTFGPGAFGRHSSH